MRQQIDRDKTVAGYVATEPKTVETARGQMVAFRLAEPQQAFNRETREYEDLAPRYYDVAVGREQLGKNVLASVEVGQRVSVTGKHSMEAYVDRDGDAGLGNRLWAEDVSASMQHNTVQVRPGVQAGGPGREAGLERQSPEHVAADPGWQASNQPVERHVGIEQGGPALSGPSR